jgi:serine/threonine-protein kinase
MADLVNSVVGDYRLEEFLGAGGMGEVYRGVHSKIGRVAAIKILTAVRDPGFTERFLNEARIQAGLHHPNIATLYDFIEYRGQPCIVMEYVDGVTLADRIRASGRLPPDQALELFRPIVEAVGYIHANGIVHRDLKSHNIKISSRGAVKLLDFGIAKGSATPRLTLAGQFVGTVHYCSPEQLRGEAVDHRSDIWALGILLYEMLVGDVPFDAPSAGEFAALVERAAQRPPSTVVTGVPAAVDAVVQRCLEKRPERRFSSASELGEAAAAALAGQRPGIGKPARGAGLAPSLGRMMDGLRRHAVAVAAVAAIGALGVIGLALMPDHRESPPPPGARTRQTAPRPTSGNQPVSISLLGGRAEVWVEGRQAGPTPCRFEAAVGDTIDVELRVPGYRPLRRSIEVLPHSNTYTYSIRDFKAR